MHPAGDTPFGVGKEGRNHLQHTIYMAVAVESVCEMVFVFDEGRERERERERVLNLGVSVISEDGHYVWGFLAFRHFPAQCTHCSCRQLQTMTQWHHKLFYLGLCQSSHSDVHCLWLDQQVAFRMLIMVFHSVSCELSILWDQAVSKLTREVFHGHPW